MEGYKTGWGGGASEVLPLLKGGQKSFSHTEGGGGGCTTRFEVVLIRELEVLAILIGGGGGGKKFPSFKRGRNKFHPRWAIFPFSHFVAPLPVINDQSLSFFLVRHQMANNQNILPKIHRPITFNSDFD